MTPQQRYYQKNKNRLLEESRLRYHQNIESEKKRAKLYHENNKDIIKEKRRIRARKKRLADPNFKIRSNVSRRIRYILKMNNSSKSGQSILKYLGYTIQNLKEHLERQFESWMSWDNYGHYRINKWNDEDLSTWTWQIDHIMPQSKLLYTNMEDNNFIKCWALSNLRPLSAKENFIKGDR